MKTKRQFTIIDKRLIYNTKKKRQKKALDRYYKLKSQKQKIPPNY